MIAADATHQEDTMKQGHHDASERATRPSSAQAKVRMRPRHKQAEATGAWDRVVRHFERKREREEREREQCRRRLQAKISGEVEPGEPGSLRARILGK
jgi:hypothetical protein